MYFFSSPDENVSVSLPCSVWSPPWRTVRTFVSWTRLIFVKYEAPPPPPPPRNISLKYWHLSLSVITQPDPAAQFCLRWWKQTKWYLEKHLTHSSLDLILNNIFYINDNSRPSLCMTLTASFLSREFNIWVL